ncbi:efflux transporter outer membrane subunit [Rugamonas sp. FT107W]|uniref:Efflux transporter outer membrane subunit n=1 Tax=Duganella vulcania TaxID=2692166 RepID=A0A845HHA4_9BURK|nr:efflux transporter outer membrane subunit [Duganella vulcania]MYN16763.1 efflux transporter outer membrane subunit [Duganella vulcania]
MSNIPLRYRRTPILILMLVIAGCAAGPNFLAPGAPSGERYTIDDAAARIDGEQTLLPGAAIDACWWQAFGSPSLNAVVEMALRGSPTIDSARATMAQAVQLLAAARGTALPQLTLDASIVHGNTAANGAGGAGTALAITPALTLDTDLFGATSRRIEQAHALLEYQRAQTQGARLTVAGNTVLLSIAIASTRAQIAAVQDIIAVDRRNLDLVRIAVEGGKSARLAMLTAESQLAADMVLLPPLQQQAAVSSHALSILTGRHPGQWTPPGFELEALRLPRDMPLVLPSALVRRRPDIVAAEAQLHAASATIGIAAAQLYPSLTLSADWRAAGASVGELFDRPVWSIAANLLAPVFNGHTLAAQRDAAIDAYAAQLGSYRQTVLQAFGQVADVLEALRHDAALEQAQANALALARKTLDLTQQSYLVGEASLLDLLQAQRLYQQARLGNARARGQRVADSAQLFIVMGGADG